MYIQSKEKMVLDTRDYMFQNIFLHPNGMERVGVELETIPYEYDKRSSLLTQPVGILGKIESVLHRIPGLSRAPTPAETEFLVGDLGKITFEPAGQLEISTNPFFDAESLFTLLTYYLDLIEIELANHNILLVASGTNPFHLEDELDLKNTKPRYLAMERYFAGLNPPGLLMMTQTTSIHINLDYGNEHQFLKRWKTLQLLCPFLTAIFANSPMLSGERTGNVCSRIHVWNRTDPTRTGFAVVLDEDTTVEGLYEKYYDFALDASVMFYRDRNMELRHCERGISFREWIESGINGIYPDLSDWQVHLSTLFPFVRLRGYFEVRYIDTPQLCWLKVPVMIFHSIIYDDDILEDVYSALKKYSTRISEVLNIAYRHGMRNSEIGEVCQFIYKKALHSIYKGKTFADESIQLAEDFYKNYTMVNRCQSDDISPQLNELELMKYFINKLAERLKIA